MEIIAEWMGLATLILVIFLMVYGAICGYVDSIIDKLWGWVVVYGLLVVIGLFSIAYILLDYLEVM